MVNPFAYPDNNITGLVPLLQYINDLTYVNGVAYLGIAILIAVFFVSFLATKTFTSDRAFGFSTFLTMIVAVFLRFLSLINDWVFALTIIIFIISLIILMRERSVEEFGV